MAGMNNILDVLTELPALPSSVVRVTTLLGDETTGIDDLLVPIASDEALAVSVLRLANSVVYGTPGRTFTLREALARLGKRQIRKVVLAAGVGPLLERPSEAYGLMRRGLWRGAIGGSIAAEMIAADCGYKEPDIASVSAMLRDIGKLAIEVLAAKSHPTLAADSEGPISFLDQEQALLGANHAELGAELAEHWGLPEPMVKAIRHHHLPEDAGRDHDQLIDIVHAADVVCLWAGLGVGDDGLSYTISPRVRDDYLADRRVTERYVAEALHAVAALEQDLHGPEDMEACA